MEFPLHRNKISSVGNTLVKKYKNKDVFWLMFPLQNVH